MAATTAFHGDHSECSLSSSSDADNWDSEYEKDRRSSVRARGTTARHTHALDSDDDSLAGYFNQQPSGMMPYGIPPLTKASHRGNESSSRALPPPPGIEIQVSKPKRPQKSLPFLTSLAKAGVVSIENPSSQRDYTIHLELDIEEDIDDKIEALVKLKRLGHFQEAAVYFDENLTDHLHEHVVMRTYAELLLEQGDYKRFFESFDDDKATYAFQCISNAEYAVPDVLDACNMTLIQEIARSYSNPELYRSHHTITAVARQLKSKYLTDPERVDTAKHQVQCRLLTLLGYIHSSSRILTTQDFDLADEIQQEVGNYRDYLGEGRHWDLRDIIYAFGAAFGPIQTCKLLFKADSLDSGVLELVHAWENVLSDDMSDICLLDILVCFCRGHIQVLDNNIDVLNTTSVAFEQARRVAAVVKDANPENTKCRPYLNWILVEMAYARSLLSIPGKSAAQIANIGPQCFRRFPGFTFWGSVLPIYVPLLSENPGWPVIPSNTSASTESNNLLAAVQCAAKELGDFSTQAACLQEMICHSPAPHGLMKDLEQLQHSVMGDKLGVLQTRMSRYLVSDTLASQRQLYQDLLIMNAELRKWGQLSHPMMQWCHRRVTTALLLTFDGFTSEAKTLDSHAISIRMHIPEGFLSEKIWYQYIQIPPMSRLPRDRRIHYQRYPGDDDRGVSVNRPPEPPRTGTVTELTIPPPSAPKDSRVPANTQVRKSGSRTITIDQAGTVVESEDAKGKAKSAKSRAARTTVEDEEE